MIGEDQIRMDNNHHSPFALDINLIHRELVTGDRYASDCTLCWTLSFIILMIMLPLYEFILYFATDESKCEGQDPWVMPLNTYLFVDSCVKFLFLLIFTLTSGSNLMCTLRLRFLLGWILVAYVLMYVDIFGFIMYFKNLGCDTSFIGNVCLANILTHIGLPIYLFMDYCASFRLKNKSEQEEEEEENEEKIDIVIIENKNNDEIHTTTTTTRQIIQKIIVQDPDRQSAINDILRTFDDDDISEFDFSEIHINI